MDFFSKDDTKTIKGFAIILMLMHHLWGYPNRLSGGNGGLTSLFNFDGLPSLIYLGGFGGICVSLFFFVGGFGIYRSLNNGSNDFIKKIKKIYINFWKVFIIFVPIAFIFYRNTSSSCVSDYSCGLYNNVNVIDLLRNFLGLSYSLNGEWWFLLPYIFMIFTSPFIKKFFDKHDNLINILFIFVLYLLTTIIFPSIGKSSILGTLSDNFLYANFLCLETRYICFWVGMLMAKDDLFKQLNDALKNNNLLNPIIEIIIWIVLIILRQSVLGLIIDLIFLPYMILSIKDLTDRIKILKTSLIKLGGNSNSIWLTHSFYCYYFYNISTLLVKIKYGIPALFVLLVISYVTSILINIFWKYIISFINKIFKTNLMV